MIGVSMPHDVFISYSSKDKPLADGVCAKIEATGIRCWIAPRDIQAGEDWPTAIAKAIAASKIMVIIFTNNANHSDEVSRELFLAAEKKVIIIPFKLEDFETEAGKAYYLGRTHWLDAINPPTQVQIQTLVERVNSFLNPSSAQPAQPAPSQPALAQTQPVQRKLFPSWLFPTAGLVILLAIVSVFWLPGLLSKAQVTQTPSVTAPSISASSPMPTSPVSISTQPANPTPAGQAPRPSLTAPVSATPNRSFLDRSNIGDMALLSTLKGHTDMVRAVAFSPDGKQIASVSHDRSLRIWDLASSQEVKKVAVAGPEYLTSLAWSPNGNLLAVGGKDSSVYLFSSSGAPVGSVKPDGGVILGLAFSPDG